MKLIEHLQALAAEEDSYFRAHLAKEDIARLEALQSLAADAESKESFLAQGLRVGWTQADARTHQIKDAVETFLDAFHTYETGYKGPDDEVRLQSAWRTFDAERMGKLIRCL